MNFRRLVTWSYDRRRRVVALWAAALAAVSVLAAVAGGETTVDYRTPGSDSSAALTVLEDRLPQLSGATIEVVYRADTGVDDPAVTSRIAALAADLRTIDHVVGAEAGPVSPDGRTGVLVVRLDGSPETLPIATTQRIMEHAGGAEGGGVDVELSGFAVQLAEQQNAGSEGVGMLAAAVILLIAFGSFLAMGLPILVALFGLGVALGGAALVANVLVVPEWATQLATMIGIGVGIDYALFIVTRYRRGLSAGISPRDAIVTAGTTAGRAVLFAGSTVVVSLFGLVFMGLDYLWGVAAATSLAVLVVMVASLTLLPALLGFAGHAIDRFRLPWLRHDGDGMDRTFAWRWSRVVQRHPGGAALGALVVPVALAAPFAGMRFGMPDAGNGPPGLTSRRAHDLTLSAFGPGANGPLLVALELPDASRAAVERVENALRAAEGVAAVFPPAVSASGDAALITVTPTTRPQDVATERLVRELRDTVLSAAVDGTGARAAVGGMTATFIDQSGYLSGRLPLLIGGVVVLSFLLLMSVFRSVLVAVKAAVMNVLSIGAAYGVMALAADGGWFGQLVGIDAPTPVPVWVPMLMFAILFGLSMDYEVFLLSRVREEYVRTGDNGTAVADGLASTARVITAAAAIMVTVFGAFVLEDQVFLKLAGLGLATAILVDATVVRMVLVPATMELLGDRNWWMPRWLQRLLPAVRVESEPGEDPPAPMEERIAA